MNLTIDSVRSCIRYLPGSNPTALLRESETRGTLAPKPVDALIPVPAGVRAGSSLSLMIWQMGYVDGRQRSRDGVFCRGRSRVRLGDALLTDAADADGPWEGAGESDDIELSLNELAECLA